MQEVIRLDKPDYQERIEKVIKEVFGGNYRDVEVDSAFDLNDPF